MQINNNTQSPNFGMAFRIGKMGGSEHLAKLANEGDTYTLNKLTEIAKKVKPFETTVEFDKLPVSEEVVRIITPEGGRISLMPRGWYGMDTKIALSGKCGISSDGYVPCDEAITMLNAESAKNAYKTINEMRGDIYDKGLKLAELVEADRKLQAKELLAHNADIDNAKNMLSELKKLSVS